MSRIAGDSPGYTFRLCRMVGPVAAPTKHGFELPSVSTIIGEVLAKPPSAMAWWGYRIFRDATVTALLEDPAGYLGAAGDPEDLEAFLKERKVSPNMSLGEAGDRGSRAHTVLECLAEGWQQDWKGAEPGDSAFLRDWAEALAMDEEFTEGTRYGWAAIEWWDDEVQPYIDGGFITNVLSEVPVFSLTHRYAGTFDLALYWDDPYNTGFVGWEIDDAKTHKPANGFTKPGKGPGYIADAIQERAYREAFEEMGLGQTIRQRTIVLRDRAYKGKSYLEDFREVPFRMFELLREAYDLRKDFEKGDEE